MEELSGSARMHKVTMTNRKSCAINGVKDVFRRSVVAWVLTKFNAISLRERNM